MRRTVGEPKVLKVDVGFGVQLPRSLDKGVDELVICGATDAFLSQAEVNLIVQERLVIRAAVEDYGQRAAGVNAGAEGGESQLGTRDEDPAYALVTDTKDLLSIFVCRWLLIWE